MARAEGKHHVSTVPPRRETAPEGVAAACAGKPGAELSLDVDMPCAHPCRETGRSTELAANLHHLHAPGALELTAPASSVNPNPEHRTTRRKPDRGRPATRQGCGPPRPRLGPLQLMADAPPPTPSAADPCSPAQSHAPPRCRTPKRRGWSRQRAAARQPRLRHFTSRHRDRQSASHRRLPGAAAPASTPSPQA